jgi:hypothetical protein
VEGYTRLHFQTARRVFGSLLGDLVGVFGKVLGDIKGYFGLFYFVFVFVFVRQIDKVSHAWASCSPVYGYLVGDCLFMAARWVGNRPELLSRCPGWISFFWGLFIYCMYYALG